ncbi:uncharacterized protein LOC118459897 [Anopheles albimanus]|uniref:uncharacterized protein LOC118459897 n=1 Tax=Anopheles albimanus TaxID=7167 RepID=UPI001640BA52|nr:uncharacterized protein LOC118459897 [Anopheles albimanus]
MSAFRVKCMYCGVTIVCDRSDTVKLVQHLYTFHQPMANQYPPPTFSVGKNGSLKKDFHSVGNDACSLSSTENSSCVPPASASACSHSANRSFLYQTTVSSWSLGDRRIYCPGCGEERIPLVRSQANGVTRSSMLALCVFLCWPFCCLSRILGGTSAEGLRCLRCEL